MEYIRGKEIKKYEWCNGEEKEMIFSRILTGLALFVMVYFGHKSVLC
jgi:hypothetical protein